MYESKNMSVSATHMTGTRTEVGNYFIANYPPFSCWKAEFIPKFYSALNHPPINTDLALYVHLPFCRQRCHYCYFRVYPSRNEAEVQRYLDGVHQELEAYLKYPALKGRRLTSVYFGGGTPSYLSDDQIREFFIGLQQRLDWGEVQECTFECEPGSVSRSKFHMLRDSGVTRVSLGFQTLDDKILKSIGRKVSVNECYAAYQNARAADFQEINIDLLAGLPGETERSWLHTIDRVLELLPDCISLYQLELAYNSVFYAYSKAGREIALPTWEEKRDWVERAFAQCEKAGYSIVGGYMAIKDPSSYRLHYTIDHFWRGGDLLALGESSFGYLQGVHYQNADVFGAYTEALKAGKLPLRRAYKLTPEEKLRREVILQLKTGTLNSDYFMRKFGVNVLEYFADEFETLHTQGFLSLHEDNIQLTRAALLKVETFLTMFYLPEHRGVRYT